MKPTVQLADELRRWNAAIRVARADYRQFPNTSCWRCGVLIPVLPRCRKCAAYVTAQRQARLDAKETP